MVSLPNAPIYDSCYSYPDPHPLPTLSPPPTPQKKHLCVISQFACTLDCSLVNLKMPELSNFAVAPTQLYYN